MAEGNLESYLSSARILVTSPLKNTSLDKRVNSTRRYITFVNVYAHNRGAPKCTKQTLTYLRRETDISTIIVGGFNNPLTSIEFTHRQKIEHMPLNDKLDKMDLTEIKHSIQQQHKMHFFPVCMEHSPG